MKILNIIVLYIFVSVGASSLFATHTWTGGTSTDWATGSNWDAGTVPGTGDDVVIPDASGTTNDPTLSSAANCHSITIDSGGILNGGSGILTVNAALVNAIVTLNGTFNYGTSTIILKPNSSRHKVQIIGLYEYYNLTINGDASTAKAYYTSSGTIYVHHNFTFTAGVFDFYSNNMEVYGLWYNESGLTDVAFVNANKITMKSGGVDFTPSDYYIDADIVMSPSSGTINMQYVPVKARSLTVTAGTFSLYSTDDGVWYDAVLGISGGAVGTLTVSGGTLDAGDADITAYGASTEIIDGTLQFNTSGTSTPSLVTNAGGIAGSGTIVAGYATLYVAGNFTFDGTFTKGTSTVSFISANNSTIVSGADFYNLNLDKTYNTTLIQTTGKVSFNHTLSYGTNGGYFKGGLRGVITGSTTYDISKFLGFTPASSGTVYITKYTGATPPGGVYASLNYIVVESATNVAVNMVKTYYEDGGDNTEMNGNISGNCEFWKSVDAGSSWIKVTDNTADDGTNDVIAYSATPSGASGTTTYFAFEDPSNQSLPVEFDNEKFYAVSVETGIKLSWLTHSEEGLKGFIVYRTTSLSNNFEIIDSWDKNSVLYSLNDGGFSSYDTDYSYIDKSVANGQKYFYRIEAYCADADREFHPKTVSAIYDFMKAGIASLSQNYPNPFNNRTIINYSLSKNMQVSLQLFNITGQIVKTLVKGISKAGSHSVALTNNDIATGVYYYQLKTPNATLVKKLILVK